MNTQPEALRLADALEYDHNMSYASASMWQAAAELRRLHALNAELLEALKECQEAFEIASDGGGVNFYEYVLSIKAKINRYKTEGELK